MPRVLLVDDDSSLVNQLRRDLANVRFDVAVAGDGVTALAEFERATPDVVVLDWTLRGSLDGLAVLRRIRRLSRAPVLMLTARGGLADKLAGFECGADDYLVKPFARRELVARLEALSRRAEGVSLVPGRSAPLRDGEFEIDVDAHRATVSGRELALTCGEFDLFALLLAHPGRTFHRGFLVDRLRGHDYAGTERAIDNLVARLRRKLGPHGGRIETVFGLGYRYSRNRE